MLFNSYAFLFFFLPFTFSIFHLLNRVLPGKPALIFLSFASLFFYGWWNPKYLALIISLMAFNFFCAKGILGFKSRKKILRAKTLMICGVFLNLAALGYFKYANFFIDNLKILTGYEFVLGQIVLPLGVSFFTFQKIALLVDVYHEKISDFNAVNYSLFVLFFPQLIAGPIVHHSEIMPQLSRLGAISKNMISQGLSLFILGLAKKTLMADHFAAIASPLFTQASIPTNNLDFWNAWTAALSYSLQLYFDFSGYSDMAIGLGLLFGIRLPVNFNSPYKAVSIIDFWRRWHITLSRFLRDYLYIPLGGNRHGETRRYFNLYLTMLLGGLWHGAGWTFILWGAMHGSYLMLNHAWQAFSKNNPLAWMTKGLCGIFLTWIAVIAAWVVFRSPDISTAFHILKNMACFSLPENISGLQNFYLCLSLFVLTYFLPNSQQIIGYSGVSKASFETTSSASFWQISRPWAISLGLLLAVCIMHLSKISEFIYFQF